MKPIENGTPAPVGSGHLVQPSDTPRTDRSIYKAGSLIAERTVVFAGFCGDLERESAARLAVAEKLAVFATAYRSHPKRNPSDGLDAALAEFYALPKG